MTLIVNVLHKDFSLIAADRLANTNGPTTITIGNVTINLPNGGRIEGMHRKLVANADGSAVAGSAGTVSEHTFVDAFKAAASPEEAVAAVRQSAYSSFDMTERDKLLDSAPQMVNASIVSYFDSEKSAFWSFVIKYTQFESSQHAYARRVNSSAHVFSVGSGSSTLHETMPPEEIGAFTGAIAEQWNEAQLAEWLDGVFRAVSDLDTTVSATYDALIATREEPTFRPLVRA